MAWASVLAAQTWRVELASGMDRDTANKRLQEEFPDIQGAEVLDINGSYGIYVGNHSSETAARAAMQQLENTTGIFNLKVTRFDSGAPAASGGAAKFRVLVRTYDTQGSALERKQELDGDGLLGVDVVPSGGKWKVYAGYEFNTREKAEEYGQSLQGIGVSYETVENVAAASSPTKSLDQIAAEFERQIRDAMSRSSWEEAARYLSDWEKADPGNLAIFSLQSELEKRRNQAQAARPTPEQPRPTPAPTDTPRPTETFESLRTQAEQAESAGNLEQAVAIWRNAQALPGIPADQALEASNNIGRLNGMIGAASQPASSGSGGLSTGLLLGAGIGIVALIVIVVLVLIFMRKKSKTPPPPVPSMGGLSMGPSTMETPSTFSTPVYQTPVLPTPTPITPAAQPQPPQKQAPPPAPANDINPMALEETEIMTPEELAEIAGQAQPRDSSSGGIALEGLRGDTPESKEETHGGSDTEDLRRIPTVRDYGSKDSTQRVPMANTPTGANDETPPISINPPTPVPQTPPSMSFEETQIDFAQHETPVGQKPGRVYYFSQNFNDENVGDKPTGWSGDYDYARLSIVERDGANGKCMKFEKDKGSGSAFYSCKFPDASGRVMVEFDLRCDHKNKYLLGFYIEKDADFRHSVHTVVHRDLSNQEKIALRLQNESEAYTLGEWVHVKFLIDLTRNVVDGYVNDKPVAVGVRLASRPRVVNTLSIRDNLATEGILMIDNIEIYQDR